MEIDKFHTQKKIQNKIQYNTIQMWKKNNY